MQGILSRVKKTIGMKHAIIYTSNCEAPHVLTCASYGVSGITAQGDPGPFFLTDAISIRYFLK
jgi:hypothetical protein